jgi:hypothetical protein
LSFVSLPQKRRNPTKSRAARKSCLISNENGRYEYIFYKVKLLI